MIGATVGRFRVLERLGAGGMGEVYLAEDPVLGRRLAVKVLAPEFMRDAERRERLLHEARAASALNHPNIVVVHDIGETDGNLWVAMERIEGETVRTWGTPRRPAAAVVKLMRQAVAALEAAHAAGLVHRDLKPENMMVRSDGILKVLDFGLARSVSPGTMSRTATMPGVILGTAPYMSPEQVLAQPAGPASDLFSIGTIFYELLTGTHPFAAATPVETMHRILHDSPELPSRVNRALTPDFDFVLNKLLAKEPSRRHASAHDLDVDLETLECECLSQPAASEAAAAKEGAPRAIAVLPFKNIGGDRELAYLGIGLADAVITRLSTSPDLIVRATSSISRYEGQPTDPRHVGQELDVSAVLDASYQRAGERFRATARLVETPSGRALWAGKVDVRFEDIFDVQDQVAHGIAEAMAASIAAPTAAKGFTPDPRAYDLVLRAVRARDVATHESFRQGLAYSEQAVAIQPNNAQAWVQLGGYAHGLVDGGFESDPAFLGKAEQAFRRALELDPQEPGAQFGLGAFALTEGRKREAWDAFVLSRRLAPNNPILYHYVGYLFRLCSMLEESLASERHGIEIDPSVPWTRFGAIRALVLLGRMDEAQAEVERARSRFPGLPRLDRYEMECALIVGDYERARDLTEGHDPREYTPLDRLNDGILYARLGRLGEARAAAAGMAAAAKIDMDHAAVYAALLANLGEPDTAFEFLERAVARGNDSLETYRIKGFFDPLHGDPRWKPFIEGVERRVAEWKRLFRWPLPE